MDRRTFVKIGLATAAAQTIPSAYAIPATPTVVFFDPRYSDSQRFAATFCALGGEQVSTERNLVQLWYAGLQARAKGKQLRLAGLTTHSDFLVVERCALDERLRVRHTIVHDCRGATTVTHFLNRSSEAMARALGTADTQWPAAVARSLADDSEVSAIAPRRISMNTARAADHPGTLVSWLIA